MSETIITNWIDCIFTRTFSTTYIKSTRHYIIYFSYSVKVYYIIDKEKFDEILSCFNCFYMQWLVVKITYVYLKPSPDISIFEYTFCTHSVTLVAIAAKNPIISKLISFIEQRANPSMTGIKLKFTYKLVCSPKTIILYILNNSSLIVLTK